MTFRYCIVLCLLFIICSCSNKIPEEEILAFTQDFLKTIQQEDEAEDLTDSPLLAFYPEIDRLDVPSSKVVDFLPVVVQNRDGARVELIDPSTNEVGTILFLRKNSSSGKLEIYDSKGLKGNTVNKWETFALRIGCLQASNDLTDIELAKLLAKAKKIFDAQLVVSKKALAKNLKVESWNWSPENSSGSLKVVNDNEMEIQGLDYSLTLFDEHKGKIKTITNNLTNFLLEKGDIFEGEITLDQTIPSTTAEIQLYVGGDFLYRLTYYQEYAELDCQ
ncbi:MAG: hypothetical protein AAF502_02130 [Bacteroidota bacterium]